MRITEPVIDLKPGMVKDRVYRTETTETPEDEDDLIEFIKKKKKEEWKGKEL